MAYCTYDDLINAFNADEILQLTDRDRDGVQDYGVLEDAQSFTDTFMDGFLRERYTLPLTKVPKSLTGIACDIVRYRLYEGEPSKTVQDRYEAALLYLRDIARGLVQLEVETGGESIAFTKPTAIFTRFSL